MLVKNDSLEIVFDIVPEPLKCAVCDGQGQFDIYNAYSLKLEDIEACWSCKGTGVKLLLTSC